MPRKGLARFLYVSRKDKGEPLESDSNARLNMCYHPAQSQLEFIRLGKRLPKLFLNHSKSMQLDNLLSFTEPMRSVSGLC